MLSHKYSPLFTAYLADLPFILSNIGSAFIAQIAKEKCPQIDLLSVVAVPEYPFIWHDERNARTIYFDNKISTLSAGLKFGKTCTFEQINIVRRIGLGDQAFDVYTTLAQINEKAKESSDQDLPSDAFGRPTGVRCAPLLTI